jgi:hypothetical protein
LTPAHFEAVAVWVKTTPVTVQTSMLAATTERVRLLRKAFIDLLRLRDRRDPNACIYGDRQVSNQPTSV